MPEPTSLGVKILGCLGTTLALLVVLFALLIGVIGPSGATLGVGGIILVLVVIRVVGWAGESERSPAAAAVILALVCFLGYALVPESTRDFVRKVLENPLGERDQHKSRGR